MNVKGQTRRPIVGVMGSGQSCDEARCLELGRWLAQQDVHLLTGGGAGVMDAVSRGFYETEPRSGLVIGVLPAERAGSGQPPARYPNRWVEVPIQTHLPLSGAKGTSPESRNHINVLTSSVVIALPGSLGTRSEVELAVRYGRPIVAYLQERGAIPQLPETVTVVSELAEVQRFVLRALGRPP